jgi:hypothetical protein
MVIVGYNGWLAANAVDARADAATLLRTIHASGDAVARIY